jgi:DNA adenine methylase
MIGLQTPVLLPQEKQFVLEPHRVHTKPFLKWAGGKTRLLKLLRQCLPLAPFPRYFEPFLGGAALFFDLAPSQAVLSDSNAELTSCYEVVRDSPNELIEELSQYLVNESEFYRIRELQPEDLPPVSRAARFIYLNKTCFNGVYRVNKSGKFNTPFGHYKQIALVDEANLRRASHLLRKAEILNCDYTAVLDMARAGDFFYFDPPYLPVSKFSDFKRYTREFFYEADHEKLAVLFAALADKGCFVLLSNSYHEKICSLYSRFSQVTVEVPRFVNCKGDRRGDVKELLIANYPLRIGP